MKVRAKVGIARPISAKTARLSLGLFAILLALAALASPARAAVPELLVKSPEESAIGDAAGRLFVPWSIAADPNLPGNVYVGDLFDRISVFTPWGEFERSFGWGVVASGPGNKPKNEIQKVTVDATGGYFKLGPSSLIFQELPQIPYDASAAQVEAAFEGLTTRLFEREIPVETSVSGPSGGPWTIEFTGTAADLDIFPLEPLVTDKGNPTLTGGAGTATVTTVQDGTNYEVCVPAVGDICQGGSDGDSAGQFNSSEAITVDPVGDVYVIEGLSNRVQKFDSEGNFILTFGYDVNKTKAEAGGASEAERNVCTAASGDTCQAGKAGTGPGRLGAGFPTYRAAGFAASPLDGTVFAGEGEKIQAFSPDGSFKEEIELPNTVHGLAVDDAGDLHVALEVGSSKFEIRTLKPHGPTAEFLGPAIAAKGVFALAVGAAGNTYAARAGDSSVAGDPQRVLEFDPAGKCLSCGSEGEGGKEGFDRVDGIRAIAAAKACGAEDVYVTHDIPSAFSESGFRESYFNIFGPPPDPTLCPQPQVPPEIAAQYATSVDADSAELRAEISPRFWDDTTYYLEYGTAPCSEGGCASKPAPPGSLLTTKVLKAKVKTAGIVLEGLEAGTTYHYRFVAESGGGGPVTGPDRAFTTSRPPAPQGCPGNEALRTGLSAALPDCRAYEMVSPLDKDGGDIRALPSFTTGTAATLDQSSLDGDKLSYGTFHSFGDAESAPFTTQYIAARGEGGWASHGISPPHGRLLLQKGHLVDTELKVLSPDLCEAWLRPVAEPPLAAGAVAGYPNLYRRTDEECGGPGWEALTTVEPPNVPAGFYFPLELTGLSADRSAAIYISNDSLPGSGAPPATPGECGKEATDCAANGLRLYFRRAGEAVPHFVCVLPDGTAARSCMTGTNEDDAGLFRWGNYQGAISAGGERVFWSTASGIGPDPLYVRENPDQPQSALAHGAASGTGTLTEGSDKVSALLAAEGKAEFTKESPTVTLLETKVGKFVAGQAVTALGKAPPGTTIKSVSGSTLTLDKNATASGTSTVSSKGPMPFEAGQEISGKGIPPKTTVLEAKAGELKLSKAASASASGVALNAASECTEAAKACTIAVSGDAEALSGTSESRFWAAAADGSAAIFTTPGNMAGPSDLYRFDVDTQATSLIAPGVPGVVGVSEDASRVYLVSKEDCGGAGQAGEPNIYLYETGEQCGAGELDFVATLDEKDSPNYHQFPNDRSSRVSADGEHLAFMSLASPTGYDNHDAETGEAAAEVYLYDAGAGGGKGKLACASCNPSGARPQGHTFPHDIESVFVLGGGHNPRVAAQVPGYENNLYAPRALSADGNRLFFESFDTLSLRDTNGLRDVYQWEAPGSGGCEEGAPSYSALNEGCIDLISSGQSRQDSLFVDADPDGSDVFFTTLESLAGTDFGLVDVYDARVGGGFPEPQPPAPQCEGEACQGTPEAPNDPTPASATFQGAGNVTEEAAPPVRKPCAKGKVRRRGKCVAKHRKKAARRAKRNGRAGR